MYVVVFFLLLWALFQLVQCNENCIENNPDPNVLYILETDSDSHNIKNQEFIDSLEVLFLQYDPKKLYPRPKILKDCSPYLKKTMDYATNLRYVIHLNVEDFYQNSYTEVIKNGFQWAGDIGNMGTKQEVCRINQKRKEADDVESCEYKKTDENKKVNTSLPFVSIVHLNEEFDEINRTIKVEGDEWAGDIGEGTKNHVQCRINKSKRKDICENKTRNKKRVVLQKNVKLVSQEVMEIPFLYDFTLNFENRAPKRNRKITKINYRILICPNTYIKNLSHFHKQLAFDEFVVNIKYFADKCERGTGDDVIAILAPDSDSIEETKKPVIFFREPFSLSVREESEKGVSAIASYTNSMIRLRSTKNLAKAMLHFIKEMNWNRVAVVSDSSEASVAYEELLRELFYEDGLAFQVMTVTESNLHFDFSQVLATLKHDKTRILIANIDETNAVSLTNQANYYNMTFFENVLWIARDWSEATAKIAAQSLGIVFYFDYERRPIQMYLNATNNVIDQSYLKKHYDFINHRQFADDIRHELDHWWLDETQIEIKRTTTQEHQIIGSYRKEKWLLYIDINVPKDRKDGCLLKSSNYYRHCNDKELLYLMMVIIVIAITILGITYFFQTPDSTYDRM